MSVRYEIRQEVAKIKWLCRNNLINSKDKMTPIYEATLEIEKQLEKL